MLIGGGVELLLVAQHVVPDCPDAAKGFVDQDALLVGGIELHLYGPLLFHRAPPPS